ncbi:hypothetical protein [Sphingomonas sp. CFBP9021]|uniref:hypothetical protein n=1 Tax=Sphingomonas sp. CFBP9021 TaxID=3096534 RepID=UPI002A6A80A1|nr:hypothetical protein [Sphingomonas sp. CFBP9021]MDY0969149.1 hypothetical protein [Sphingomonas sp. CFBP9021]
MAMNERPLLDNAPSSLNDRNWVVIAAVGIDQISPFLLDGANVRISQELPTVQP